MRGNCNIDELIKKDIEYRELSSGSYIVYAYDTALLEVSKETLNKIICMDLKELRVNDRDLFDELLQNRYIVDKKEMFQTLPKEPSRNMYIFMWSTILIVILFLLSTLIFKNINVEIWNGYQLIDKYYKNSIFIIYSILFLVVTTFLHELMHGMFGNLLGRITKNIKFSFRKSVVYIDLTHIWIWKSKAKLAVILAGLIIDVLIITIILLIDFSILNNIFLILILLRVIWQFRVHSESDFRYFVMLLLDNPFIEEDVSNNLRLLRKKDVLVWKLGVFIGKIVEWYLLLFWLIPSIYRIFVG